MYLTAHHVVNSYGEEGINVFRHLHGRDYDWPQDASSLPERDPGKLDRDASIISIKPGGNRVRTYIDVLTPDDTPREKITDNLNSVDMDLDERRNPTVFENYNVTIRFGVEIGLQQNRRALFQELIAALYNVIQ